MPHFVSRLHTHQGHLNFYFNLIYTAEGERYYVSTVTRDGKTLTFYTLNEQGNWKLVDPTTCPGWIVEMEERFATEIIQYQIGGN